MLTSGERNRRPGRRRADQPPAATSQSPGPLPATLIAAQSPSIEASAEFDDFEMITP